MLASFCKNITMTDEDESLDGYIMKLEPQGIRDYCCS